ncbi:PAS domain S-box protein [Paenibacillus ferrarius]|uniref:PAS domain S-box protein n=1 Tax=Paenibacillus ferrarius TaxID=1469647 RepID=UPI003D2D52B1
MVHKQGDLLQVTILLSLIRDESRQPLFVIAEVSETSRESNRAANELKVKTIQLESFLEHNADAIWMMNMEDTLLEVNPAFEMLFGWPAAEIKGSKLPIIPDSLKASMEQIHQSIKKGETVVGLETIRQHKNGRLLDVEATLSPLRDHHGTIIGITGICRDVTSGNRTKQELQVKTMQLESFIQHNADAIWMINEQGTVLNVNPAFETLFGWSAAEIKGQKLPMIPGFLKNQMEDLHQRIKNGETVVGLETIRQHKNGQLLDVEATLSPLMDHDGRTIGITGICRDISARKQAQQELNARTMQVESFIENNADAILICNSDERVESMNKSFEDLFGWPKEALVGMKIASLPFIPSEYLEETNRLCKQIRNGVSLSGIETRRLHKDGEFINVIISASPFFDGNGKLSGRSVTYRDITTWKMAQEHMKNSEKLSVAGQLAAGIAHEIRNPITSIKGFLHLMKSGVGDRNKYFDIMTSEIERIELILSELLLLAKPQTIKYERKDIRVLLTQVMTLLDSQAILNNVQFVTEFKPGVTHIYCDENQLKQVFINFIKNSIESMPDGGNFRMKIHSTDEQELLIRLSDEGCGIPQDVLLKLGQPFITTKEQGTGLGFMVSKKIIENLAGTFKVQSEVGKGTVIDIRLPVSNKETPL